MPHVVTEVANNIGIDLSASFSAESAPQVNNVGAHLGAIDESITKLSAANEIRDGMTAALENDSQPAINQSSMGMADALKSNIASGALAAVFTMVGLPMAGLAITTISAANTIKNAIQPNSESTYFKSAIEEEAEGYTSYADSAVPSGALQQNTAPVQNPNQQLIPQQKMQVAIDDVVNRVGEDEVFDQMGHMSQEENELIGQLVHHKAHLDIIAQAPAPMMMG